MSLLSIKTTQLNKLSLKEAKLPAPKERELKTFIPTKPELKIKEITAEDFYNKLTNTYPDFKKLVDEFDLKIESFKRTVNKINKVI